MIIDAHSHGLHRDYLDKLSALGGDRAKKILMGKSGHTRDPIPHAYDVALRLEQLDRNGIDMQVVTPFIPMDSNLLPGDVTAKLNYARVLNNCMAELMEGSKGRLISVGSIPLVIVFQPAYLAWVGPVVMQEFGDIRESDL